MMLRKLPPVSTALPGKGFSWEIQKAFRQSRLVNSFNLSKAQVEFTLSPWMVGAVGLTHAGRLGMGLLPKYRGQGWGAKLVTKALSIAFKTGLERIELEVFASNVVAIKLYKHFGFREEGRKRMARKLDGVYDDVILFGLLREEWQQSPPFHSDKQKSF